MLVLLDLFSLKRGKKIECHMVPISMHLILKRTCKQIDNIALYSEIE